MATHSDVPEGGRAGDPTSDESEKDRLDVGRVVAEQVATEPHPARDEKPHAAGHQMERECRDSPASGARRDSYIPMAWYPESTYSVVPVTFLASSESR